MRQQRWPLTFATAALMCCTCLAGVLADPPEEEPARPRTDDLPTYTPPTPSSMSRVADALRRSSEPTSVVLGRFENKPDFDWRELVDVMRSELSQRGIEWTPSKGPLPSWGPQRHCSERALEMERVARFEVHELRLPPEHANTLVPLPTEESGEGFQRLSIKGREECLAIARRIKAPVSKHRPVFVRPGATAQFASGWRQSVLSAGTSLQGSKYKNAHDVFTGVRLDIKVDESEPRAAAWGVTLNCSVGWIESPGKVRRFSTGRAQVSAAYQRSNDEKGISKDERCWLLRLENGGEEVQLLLCGRIVNAR